MSGDYSRVRFNARNDFSGILQQQGRVQIDSDANELVRIMDRRFRAQTSDTIGRCVVPRETAAGFEIKLVGGALTIGRGRIYVDGLLAENHGNGNAQFDGCLAEEYGDAIGYAEQPYFPNAATIAPLPGSPGRYLVYVVVHEREVTYVEQPDLVEKAVAQDTVTALQTVWQVRVLPGIPGDITCVTPDGQFSQWQDLTRPSAGRLSTSEVEVAEETDPCSPVAGGGGYRGLENQLYRVEIHRGGPIGTATFKWSRDNASVTTSVMTVQGTQLGVASTGRDSVLRFRAGDWIEITDDWRELSGLPPEMRKAMKVNTDTRTIEIDTALPAADFPTDPQGSLDQKRHTRIRRWDQTGAEVENNSGLIPVPAAGTAMTLENGVQVTFDLDVVGGEFKAADHWSFAARIADGRVDPLLKAPPHGIHKHYGRLAIVTLPVTVTDCRVLWPPAPKVEPAERSIRVRTVLMAKEPLRNDTEVPASRLIQGIQFVCDAEVDPVAVGGKPVCVVTLDLPYPLNDSDVNLWGPRLLGFQPLKLAATLSTEGIMISWRLHDEPLLWLRDGQLFDRVKRLHRESRVLAHLTLKGNVIWSGRNPENPSVYLDGDTFGLPSLEGSGSVDVRLPSGDGRRGGDFEMWFWVSGG